jgi:hypothetical protein
MKRKLPNKTSQIRLLWDKVLCKEKNIKTCSFKHSKDNQVIVVWMIASLEHHRSTQLWSWENRWHRCPMIWKRIIYLLLLIRTNNRFILIQRSKILVLNQELVLMLIHLKCNSIWVVARGLQIKRLWLIQPLFMPHQSHSMRKFKAIKR